MLLSCLTLPTPFLRLFRGVALILAVNYFSFQVELFDDEYEANHPRQSEGCAVSAPTLTWESFDKDNAPPPIVVDALITIAFIGSVLPGPCPPVAAHEPHRYLRDKSPPFISPA